MQALQESFFSAVASFAGNSRKIGDIGEARLPDISNT
jgi:hypothetical protein